jgi:MFS transporter, LPLT family, lysophospholipid transporter
MMGIAVMLLAFYSKHLFPVHWGIYFGRMHIPGYLIVAYIFLMIVGGLSGFFVVPMTALLQHRGHVLLSAGHSIAVQNFNENLSILVMLGVYALLIKLQFSIYTVIALFGLFLSSAMTLVRERHYMNLREGPLPQIPAGDPKP